MQQLTEMDSNFLQQETVLTPMHISPVIVYDQSKRKGGKVRFKEILQVFGNNLGKSTIFRRKLAGGAMGLGTTSPETRLHVIGGQDVTLSGGGQLQLGSQSGWNPMTY